MGPQDVCLRVCSGQVVYTPNEQKSGFSTHFPRCGLFISCALSLLCYLIVMLSLLCYHIGMLSGEILASLSPSLRGVLCICTCWMSMYYSGPFQVSAVTSECTPCCLYYGHALCVYSWFCLMVVVRLFYLPHGGCKVIC